MKKIFYLASIAALAFSSCAKDETTGSVMGTVGGSKIKAAVEADDTRTHLEEVDGKYEFRWSKNDILGVYGDGENSAPNVAFTLLDSSIDQAAGVFESNYKLLEGDNYVAYYPYQPGSKMVPTWTYDAKKNATLDASSIKLSIPASQNYAPASFNTLTAPAISDTFVLDEDGNADVTMQPVADYLFVNMMSTEPIQKLTLKLYDNKASKWLPIAGEGTLYPYVIKDTEKVRYALGVEGMTETEITLNSGQLTGAVCHEPNVYVFTIPAGILGMNRDIMARIIVNGETVSAATKDIYYFDVTGTQLNGGVIPGDGKTTKDKNEFREVDWSKTPAVASRRIENTVFWANPMIDTDGDEKVDTRDSFLYNPEDAFIIRNEVDFLQYMNEYANGGKLGTESKAMGKDAFVCSEYEFDFSDEKMGKLATQIKDEYLRAYISDYAANGMPCIEEYENDFRGNGAVLKSIEGLQSWHGLFGEISGTINEITFDGIKAADIHPNLETRATGNYDLFVAGFNYVYGKGQILGEVKADNAKANNIYKVVVKNAVGGSVYGVATVAAFNGTTFENVAGLNNVVGQLVQNADLDMTKTWDSVKGVKNNVFGMIKAVEATDAEGNVDGHHVVTIAKGGDAEYKTLASVIYVQGAQGDTSWWNDLQSSIGNKDFDLEEFISDWANYYYYSWTDDTFRYDNCATSVVIEDVSYWTGDYINNAVADTKTKNYAIAYAEQLANGMYWNGEFAIDETSETWAILQRDINLNTNNNYTYWPMSQILTGNLDGNKKTITGVQMITAGNDVAPFRRANAIKDLTVNGVDILAQTQDINSISVPNYIAGLTLEVKSVTNVSVNNINLAAYDYSGGFNDAGDAYYGNETIQVSDGQGKTWTETYRIQPIIGWVAARGTDAQFTKVSAQVSSSNIKGLSALVGRIDLDSVDESYFEDCSVNLCKMDQLTDFVPVDLRFSQYMLNEYGQQKLVNAAGTMVGLVVNDDNAAKSIKFNGSGAPKFVYDADWEKDNNKINVFYNNSKNTTLLGLEE